MNEEFFKPCDMPNVRKDDKMCFNHQVCCYYCDRIRACFKNWKKGIMICSKYGTKQSCHVVDKEISANGFDKEKERVEFT